MSLAGLFPPIPTPFDASGEVDYDHLKSNFDLWNSQPLSGYVVGGSNGEFVFLTAEERVEVVRRARQSVPSDRLLIAGAAAESTRATIAITQHMADVGADAAILVTPHYFRGRMTSVALQLHYEEVADRSSIPVVLYSVPANTGIDLPLDSVMKLSDHPNIIGIKDSGGDVARIGSMVHETPETFQVLAGSAGFLLGALAVGAVGGVVALANIAALRLAELIDCFHSGRIQKARAIQLPLIDVNAAVTSRFGVAGLKAAMDMLGYYGGPVRAPLRPLDREETEALRVSLSRAGIT